MYYENIIIARQDISPAHVEELSETFAEIVKNNSGKVTKTEYCGLRPLAYPIKKNRKGHYVILNIDGKPESIQELERNLKINEDILRFMTVRVEKLNDGPSALYKQSRNYVDGATRGQVFKANTDKPKNEAGNAEKTSSSHDKSEA